MNIKYDLTYKNWIFWKLWRIYLLGRGRVVFNDKARIQSSNLCTFHIKCRAPLGGGDYYGSSGRCCLALSVSGGQSHTL